MRGFRCPPPAERRTTPPVGCGESSPQKRVSSSGWRPTVARRLLFATGHVHDGGTRLQSKKVCVSANFPARSSASPPPRPASPADAATGGPKHISGVCKVFGTVSVGDTLTVVARYNTTMYPLMPGHDGAYTRSWASRVCTSDYRFELNGRLTLCILYLWNWLACDGTWRMWNCSYIFNQRSGEWAGLISCWAPSDDLNHLSRDIKA